VRSALCRKSVVGRCPSSGWCLARSRALDGRGASPRRPARRPQAVEQQHVAVPVAKRSTPRRAALLLSKDQPVGAASCARDQLRPAHAELHAPLLVAALLSATHVLCCAESTRELCIAHAVVLSAVVHCCHVSVS